MKEKQKKRRKYVMRNQLNLVITNFFRLAPCFFFKCNNKYFTLFYRFEN